MIEPFRCTSVVDVVASQPACQRNQGAIEIGDHIDVEVDLTVGGQHERLLGLTFGERHAFDFEFADDAADRNGPIVRVDRVQPQLHGLLLHVAAGTQLHTDHGQARRLQFGQQRCAGA
jgi:hypothetical protein